MKKTIFAAVLCVFAGLFFNSCGNKAALTPVEIWYGATFGEAGEPDYNWPVYSIVRDKLHIQLTLSAVPGIPEEADKKILAAAQANHLPDLFVVSGTVLNQLMASGLVSEVDDMYDLMPTRTAHMYDEQTRKSYSMNKKHYGLSQPGAINKNEGMLIRKDWLDNLGLEIPVTLDDYMKVMKAFTYDDPDKNGRNDTYGYGAYLELKKNSDGLGTKFEPIFGAFGVEGTINLTREGAGLNLYKDDYYKALDFVRQMNAEKVIDPNWFAYRKDDFRNAWKSGRFGIMKEQNAAFALENNYAQFDQSFPEGEWIVIDPPAGPDGKKSVGIYTDQGRRLYAVSANARAQGKVEAIARLLEWMSSDEGYYLLGFGEEGVNYLKNSEGYVTTEGLPDPSKAYTRPEMAKNLQLRNMVFYNSEVELIGKYPEWTTKNGKKLSAYKVLKDMQGRAWTPCFGSEGIPAPSSDLKKFWEQSLMDFVTGKRALTPENWQGWLNEFTRRGGNDWERKCLNYAESKNLLTEAEN